MILFIVSSVQYIKTIYLRYFLNFKVRRNKSFQDAYYLVPIGEYSRKFLKIRFNGRTYEFKCLPFGLNTASYVFT